METDVVSQKEWRPTVPVTRNALKHDHLTINVVDWKLNGKEGMHAPQKGIQLPHSKQACGHCEYKGIQVLAMYRAVKPQGKVYVNTPPCETLY